MLTGWKECIPCHFSTYFQSSTCMNIFQNFFLQSLSFTPNNYGKNTHFTSSKLLTWHLFPRRRYTCSFSSRVSRMEPGWSVPDSDFMFYDKTVFCKQFLKLNSEQLIRILKYGHMCQQYKSITDKMAFSLMIINTNILQSRNLGK
jgi:hypothetical protein